MKPAHVTSCYIKTHTQFSRHTTHNFHEQLYKLFRIIDDNSLKTEKKFWRSAHMTNTFCLSNNSTDEYVSVDCCFCLIISLTIIHFYNEENVIIWMVSESNTKSSFKITMYWQREKISLRWCHTGGQYATKQSYIRIFGEFSTKIKY